MAISEQVILDITSAERQIAALETQLAQLSTPISVPVDVDSTGSVDQIRREITQADSAAGDLNQELNETEDSLRDVGTQAKKSGDDIEDAGKRGIRGFTGLDSQLKKLGGTFLAFAGARELGQFLRESIDAASDLEESTSKAQVVFGNFYKDIQSFASTAPQALGLANAQALEFTGTFGNLFVALGLTQQAAAELAPDIVQLGADLASFNNLEVTDALEKLRAGLVGEAEPLRSLGVNINAALVEAKALELGLVDVNGTVSEAAKVQARYALILEQTTTAQGDFARTADGLANSQRTLSGEWENASAAIGQALIPALLAVVPVASDAARALGTVGLQLGVATGNISQEAANLQIFALNAGVAADSAINLFGTLVELENQAKHVGDTNRESAKATEDFRESIDDIVAAWGGNIQETQILINNLDDLVEQFGLTEEAAEALRAALQQQQATQFATREDEVLLNNLARSVGGIKTAFQETGPLISGFGEELEKIGDVDLNIQSLADQFGNVLPNALDAAREAMRDDENEIVTDFSDFLGNLQAELDAQASFAANLGILRALGLDDLADTFASLGLDAAAALADAVANPALAQEAEEALEQQAADQAHAFNQAFLEALDPNLSIDVKVKFIREEFGLAGLFNDPGEVVVDGGRGGTRPGDVTVHQTFTSPETPSTDRARAGQQINSIISGGNFAQ